MRAEETRRQQRARLRKLKRALLPLLQTIFVLVLLFWPWEEERGRAPSEPTTSSGKACGVRIQYQCATWSSSHVLSPTVRAAAA